MSGDFAWWRDRDWVLSLIKRLEQGLAIIINGGGAPKTAAVVGSGITYTVKPTDAVIPFDSSIGSQAQPVAILNAGTYITRSSGTAGEATTRRRSSRALRAF